MVAKNTGGITFLFKKNKIDGIQGIGSFKDKNTISIKKPDGTTQEITGKNIIIATGSKPSSLPFIQIDKKRIITSTEALNVAGSAKTFNINRWRGLLVWNWVQFIRDWALKYQ